MKTKAFILLLLVVLVAFSSCNIISDNGDTNYQNVGFDDSTKTNFCDEYDVTYNFNDYKEMVIDELHFDFFVNEWDECFNVSQISDKEFFSENENEIFIIAERYINEKNQVSFETETTILECVYNRNSHELVIGIEVDNLNKRIDDYISSDEYIDLVLFALQWSDYIEHPAITKKSITILCDTSDIYGDEYYSAIAFSLSNDGMVLYTSNHKIEKISLVDFVKKHNMDYFVDQTKQDLRQIIDDTKSFIDFETKKRATVSTLGDINYIYGYNPERWACVDLDGDGKKEILIQYAPTGSTAVLHEESGEYCAYYISCRGILGLKADGTMSYADGASDGGVGRIFFSQYGLEMFDIVIYSESEKGNFYIMNGKSVTKSEVENEIIVQHNKPDVVWNLFY